MGKVREHSPVVIEEINGLWQRGDDETCPSDHLIQADNIQFIHSGIETRNAIRPYVQQDYAHDLRQVRRVYNYNTQTGQTLLVLVEGGLIYHVISPSETYEILNLPGMEDFAFISIAGRAYISPFKIYTTNTAIAGEAPEKYALGMKDQFLYVYYRPANTPVGTTVRARVAGGVPPSNTKLKPIIAYNNNVAGKVTKGYHSISVAYNDGKVEKSLRATVDAPGDLTIKVTNIPIGEVGTTSRTIVMTKAGIPYSATADNSIYKVATIPDNTTTSYVIDIADADLVLYVEGATPPPPLNAMYIVNPPDAGFCDTGFHLFGVVYETDTGYLSAPGPEFFTGQTLVDTTKTVRAINVPTSPNLPTPSNVVKRHMVATKEIIDYSGDQNGYQFFFIPKATIENNTATTIDFNFYDSDLVADASHLTDNFSKIPAGVDMCEYHSRLVIVGNGSYPEKADGTPDTTQPDNRSVAWLSAPGEPEAFNKIDGLIITPLDGKPLTHCQDFRDVLYLFKQNRTYSVVDNQDDPTTWGPVETVDLGIGCSVHGIAEVLDSGGTNIDYLIIVDWSGLMLFNGTYARPELSWKIENIWDSFNKNEFHNIQIINDSINKKIWLTSPDFPTLPGSTNRIIWLADYGNGMNPKEIRWARWLFETYVTSLVLYRADKMILGTYQLNPATTYGF